MRIITAPVVTVVGHSTFIEHPTYKVPADGEEMVRLGAFAAKGCYDSYGEDGRNCLDNQRGIIAHRHGSVAEHMTISVFIEGVTRGLTLELNRHRHLAISQRSTRYTKEEDAAIVLEPYYARIFELGGTQEEIKLVDSHIDAAEASIKQYQKEVHLLEELNPLDLTGFDLRKWARGKARNILPHSLETRGTWTGNLRAWRHIIETRSSRYAEPEIRRLIQHIFEAISPLAPVYFEDYEVEFVKGLPEYTTKYGKI